MKDLILIGGGGHCKSCIDVIESCNQFSIKGLLDLPEKKDSNTLGYDIIGDNKDIPDLVRNNVYFLITVGTIGDPAKRIELYELVSSAGGIFPVIISPSAVVSKHARIGSGTIIMHQSFVNASATIGKNCIINTKALVEHDAVIGDHCHISTGAIINGGVHLGHRSFFGSGSVSKQYITIPDDSFIKANSLVK